MKHTILVACCLVASIVASPVTLHSQGTPDEPDSAAILQSLPWLSGPATAQIDNQATLEFGANRLFLAPPDSGRFMQLIENPSHGTEHLLMGPDFEWFAIFEFDEIGYVKDDEKIDADAVLDSIREATAAANHRRKEQGWSEVRVIGWSTPPFYNQKTRSLEWAVLGESNEGKVVNYNTRVLGRNGVMRVKLVTDPEILSTALGQFQADMVGFGYVPGRRYAEYTQGDKIAAYGLTGLILGGAAAVAVKSGFGKVLWKVVVGGVVALIAGIGAIFRKRS